LQLRFFNVRAQRPGLDGAIIEFNPGGLQEQKDGATGLGNIAHAGTRPIGGIMACTFSSETPER
jgi:hypothetical protein